MRRGAAHGTRAGMRAGRALGVGIVGCGFATRSRHLPALRRLPEVRVVALADLDEAALASASGGDGGVRRYRDVHELLEDPRVDAVAVCVPASAHADVALAAIEAGKHVLVEKPLALTLEDAGRIVERARRSPVAATVGFNLRRHRLVLEAHALVRGGAIGALEAVRTVYSDPILGRPDLPPWRTRREAGGGALLEKAVHHVDLWRFLAEDEVEEVCAFGRSVHGDDQTVVVAARLRSGAVAEALVCDRTATGNEVALYGERGAIHLDLYRSDGLRLVGAHDLPGAPGTRMRTLLSALRQVGANLAEIRRGGAFDASYEEEWRSFARAIRLGEAPSPTLEDGRRALEVVAAASASIARGAAVPLAAVDPPAATVAAAP